LVASQRWQDLEPVLCDLDFFERMWQAGRKYDWMRYWRALPGNTQPGVAYQASLAQLVNREGETERVGRLSDLIGCFLRDMGENEAALPFMKDAVRLSEKDPRAGRRGPRPRACTASPSSTAAPNSTSKHCPFSKRTGHSASEPSRPITPTSPPASTTSREFFTTFASMIRR